jgi:hypothetical protein
MLRSKINIETGSTNDDDIVGINIFGEAEKIDPSHT